ncbi:hypothetical protein K435DRAFT_242586 [Dendrothele bispora CBS 962.96]|uniref:Uncharacterized protein n=1 Tax=Dendrothele bispora (strain CBS 962.96) TaxID=1314807 RepID=A0A4V4HEH5_DENBC|nr:hypothetical protein K435DRAFT_242586 [Dendrothele bispora CBS 962.96]
MTQLIESDSWPIGPQDRASSSMEEREKRNKEAKELVDLVTRLDKNVKEVNELTREFLEKDPKKGKDKDKAGDDGSGGGGSVDDDDAMDVDQPAGDSRPLKRRRLSSAGDDPATAADDDGTSTREAPVPPTPDQVREMKDALDRIEDFLTTVQNNLIASEEETREYIGSVLDQREEEQMNNPAFALSASGVTPDRFGAVEQNMEDLGMEVKGIADNVAELMKKMEINEEKIRNLEKEDEKVAGDIKKV